MNVRTKFEVRIALPVPVIEGSDIFEFGERA